MEDEKCIQLILHAGNAVYLSSLALDAAKLYEFDKAEQRIKDAEKEEQKAHQIQTDMITLYAKGVQSLTTILIVHAQDHVTSGNLSIRFAKEQIYLYKKLYQMENGGTKI